MAQANKDTAKNPPANDLPMFFKRPAALDVERHAKAGVTPSNDLSFAAGTNSIFLNCVEFSEAAKFYPIVFSSGEMPMPAILTGLEQSNYFVDDKGHWLKDTYIPAYVRRYPFVFMELPEQQKFVLCIDEAAEQFSAKGGRDTQPLMINGKPSELSLNALEFCKAFQQQLEVTKAFSTAVKEAGLLSGTRSDATLQNGRKVQLTGFQVIDEEKFKALSDEQVLEFHKKGWLPLIYFMLLSASNWRRLIALATEAETRK